MDTLVDTADVNLLVFSPEYLGSTSCQREMKRALARDPGFSGIVLPTVRKKCKLPPAITLANPLWVDLENDRISERWEELFKETTSKNLGMPAPKWLEARDAIYAHMLDHRSMTLEIGDGVQWRALVEWLALRTPRLLQIDLMSGATASRRGFIEQVLSGLGVRQAVPHPPDDLLAFHHAIASQSAIVKLAILNSDRAGNRIDYDENLFDAIRYLIECRRLMVIFVSKAPFLDHVRTTRTLSEINSLVRLRLEAGS